ncbi:MAG: GNAT family N-acetyltransferase [Betaproteobacteria bacterium]
MRSPIPFNPPPLPVVASPLIRDDVALEEIPAASWNALAGTQPFLSHAFLSALHETGCAAAQSGWTPRYLTAWRDSALVGALPLYSKSHSYGEYVFDWGWADAYRRHGRRYYPKWLVAVPFTPVPGPRLLAPDPATRHALFRCALDRVRDSGHSSLHILFPTAPEAAEGEALGMIPRAGLQFHWTNPGYRDFADFLAAFTHDKRKKVKQERRRLLEAGVTFERIRGPDITADDWRFFYRRYEHTYREHHSTPYLNLEFFRRIGASLPENILLIVGSRLGQRICAALDLYDGDTLWGRYWGTAEFVSGLHFEACYYQSIEFCIEQRLARFEGGAQGIHKLARGLLPVATHSLHAIADREFAAAIADYCGRERVDIAHSAHELEAAAPFKMPHADT